MNAVARDILSLVFRRSDTKGLGEISLDGKMLAVLSEFDGKTPLGEIAGRLGLDDETIGRVAAKLSRLKLVVPVQAKVPALDQDFLNYLFQTLSLAVGPVAEIILEDTVAEMNYSLANFPTTQAAALVESLAREIQRDDKKLEFKRSMLAKIQEKGY